jgi:mannose/fructose/sorbose-specific phosphotransferase system IIB component
MKIAMVRIDERLIHGQITMGWVRTTGADLILVANDAVARDSMQKKLMQLASPPGVEVEIYSLDETSKKISAQAWPNKNILMLIRNPIDFLRLVENGLPIKKVKIGGVRSPDAKIKLTKEVSATDQELEAWKHLDQLGIRMEVQWVPGAGTTILNDVLRSHKG